MYGRFKQIMENMRGLIKEESWSASSGYLLAVSGGMDSMCMADLFLNTLGNGSFAVAHCNFHLRGEESDADEALVAKWAQENGVKMFKADFDTASYSSEQGLSIEMAARELRYNWFAALCSEHGFAALAVAHNANDNAETLILNLLRGTGLNGLHGIADVSSLGFLSEDVKVIRPLLEFTRKQIEGYVMVHKVPYRHDSSNFESEYKRNRIRNEVFPVFEKINPSYVRTLNREIGYFAEAGEIVDDWCKAQLDDIVSYSCRNDEVLEVNLKSLVSSKHWKYLLYHILEPYGFNSQTLTSIEELLESGRTISGKRFESATHILRTERQRLVVIGKLTDDAGVIPDLIGEPFIPVRSTGAYHCNGRRFTVEVVPWTKEMPLKQPPGVLIADADRLTFPFVCRRWRQGDWFVPFGMSGRKKVSDLFADLKYDAFQKDEALMIVDCRGDLAEQQHIAGVLGVRLDNRYRVDEQTKSIIRITITEIH